METITNIAEFELIHDEQKPIIFYGSQGKLSGSINLHNKSQSKLTLKTMPIQAPKLLDQLQQPLGVARVNGRLYPNEQGKVSLNVSIDPSTPPGIYEATVVVGGKKKEAQINVSEHIKLEIEPDELTLNIKKKLKYEYQFIVTNIGNVVVTMMDKLIVPVKSDGGFESSVQQGLSETCYIVDGESGDRKSANDIPLDNILCGISKHQVGLLTIQWEKASLQPGETRSIKSLIELPANMQSYYHYYADILLYSADIHLDIYP